MIPHSHSKDILQLLYNIEGRPAVDTVNNPFTDIPSGKWYTSAVLWAYQNGVTTGTSATTFSPDTLVTREQVAVFLYRYMKDYKKAEAALENCEKDADWYNAMGVIALRNNDLNAAAEYFALSGNETSVKNAAIIDILDGEYEAAAAKLAGGTDGNAVLAQILVGNYAAADKLSCKCYKSYYIRAIAAARRGDAEGVKTNLEKACKSKAFAEKAAKDVEFSTDNLFCKT